MSCLGSLWSLGQFLLFAVSISTRLVLFLQGYVPYVHSPSPFLESSRRQQELKELAKNSVASCGVLWILCRAKTFTSPAASISWYQSLHHAPHSLRSNPV